MDDDRDDAMLEGRLSGKSSRAIAKQMRCSSSEVDAAVDRRLDYELDNSMRLRAIKLDLARLEQLMSPFYERATKDHDVPAGTLCVKILERRALLLGLDSPTRVDVVTLQAEERPTSFEKIRAAIFAVARGNGQPAETSDVGDSAVGVLSGPGADKTSY